MSWMRKSPLRTNFGRQRSRDSPPKDADPTACYDSFKKHWQQSHDIILHTRPPKSVPSQDDVLGVVNHVDQMVTLLLLELRNVTPLGETRRTATPTHSPCLEHLLNENLLDKLYEWSLHTGRFGNAVRLEQLKLYELLVSHSGALLAHEPVARPLLRLLEQCADDVMPFEVEKKLIVLLNQLCVALMQNMALLDLFFHPTSNGKSKFIIFTLLIPHVHKEGGVGQQARDAMLLCMSLSKKNHQVGLYIADHSNVCPVLATGLSGLYSLLPRKLDIEMEDWHRLTPDDINDMPAVMQLMNSLEFCNAVAQVAHPLVQKQLLEFLYQGFLVPVMGPALLQTTVEELVAATAYFDLFLRSVTEPGLLRSLIRFLLEDNYDECRILDSLIQRISSRSRLCIVTLALFETLVDLNCEDVMLELCLGSLTPCSHVMLSQRRRLRDIDPFGRAAEKFLSLAPNCCTISGVATSTPPNSLPNIPLTSRRKSLDPGTETLKSLPIPINYGARLSETLYGNYHAYLCDARQKIAACYAACSNWSSRYDGETSKESNAGSAATLAEENTFIERTVKRIESNEIVAKDKTVENNVAQDSSVQNILDNIESLLAENEIKSEENESTNVVNTGALSLEEQAKLDADIAELLNEEVGIVERADDTLQLDKKGSDSGIDESNTAMNSLLSLGESSGYESFAFKGSSESTPDNEPSEDRISEHEETETESSVEPCVQLHGITDVNFVPNEGSISGKQGGEGSSCRRDIFDGRPNIGIFLDVVLRKLECMTNNNVYVNLHLTGLLSRLAIYPQPLLQSFLLNHSLVFQPSIRSLFQILAPLKQKIDQFLSRHNDVEKLVEQARSFLIGREDRLVNARKNALEASAQASTNRRNSSASEPFSRGEPKRRSLTSSLSQMFRRAGASSGPSSLTGSISQPSSISEDRLEIVADNSGHRYYAKTLWESPSEISPVQNIILCAVVLDEWLKELAAIAQEHAIASVTNGPEFRV